MTFFFSFLRVLYNIFDKDFKKIIYRAVAL